MFGQIPVTRPDVYAWLLGVVNLDPANFRALEYFRGYNVASKIAVAKLDGTFDTATQAARESSRYRELLTESPETVTRINIAGLGFPRPPPQAAAPLKARRRAPNRPPEVIKKERAHMKKQVAIRKQLRASHLCRLPTALPPLEDMLDELGCPSPAVIAMAFDVCESTARRWINGDAAPRAVQLALYWITNNGATSAHADAHNHAVASARRAATLESRVAELERLLEQAGRISEFGSANDPSPHLSATVALTNAQESTTELRRAA